MSPDALPLAERGGREDSHPCCAIASGLGRVHGEHRQDLAIQVRIHDEGHSPRHPLPERPEPSHRRAPELRAFAFWHPVKGRNARIDIAAVD
jgi:hypothetical protein